MAGERKAAAIVRAAQEQRAAIQCELRAALAEMLTWVDGNLQTSGDEVSPVTNISDAQRGSTEVTRLRPSGTERPASSGSLPL